MKKKAILFAGLAVVCLAVILSICVYTAAMQKQPIHQFKKYLEAHAYSCSKYTCTMQSERVDGDVTETYSEVYQLKEHTFTATWVHTDPAKGGTVWQMEYIYNYADDTVTMKLYDSADACASHEPTTVYVLNNEEELDCTQGDLIDTEQELYNNMFRFKEVLQQHLEEAGVTLQDIIL